MLDLEAELTGLLQDSNSERPLDSLEMLVVRTAIRSRGIDITDDHHPTEPTLGGWMKWLDEYSKAG
jgi:aryl carrier-like protein